MRADWRYASPHMIAVIAAAYARPGSLSYGSERDIRSAPRFAKPRPSGRNFQLFSPIASVGYAELSTMISIAVIVVAHALRNDSGSSSPSGRWNLRRFSDARLHAELSRNMYSEHGFDALIRLVLMHGCQSLIVVSYWMPGSPQIHAASAILRITVRALWVSSLRPSRIARVCQSASRSTAVMNSSVTRTEWLAFW